VHGGLALGQRLRAAAACNLGADPNRLIESVHFPEEAKRLLTAIKKLGVHLSIDDFGTGYSSMSLIKEFPVDTIKVDRSFVRDLPTNVNDCAITKAVIALGKALDLTIVAEGVEMKAQERFLRDQSCDQIQGYLFAKPLSAEDFGAFARAHSISLLKEQVGKGRSPLAPPRRSKATTHQRLAAPT
jgi:EAL domain-containing protein (putative c-di-GMP-specific phosphodiesterase class I)